MRVFLGDIFVRRVAINFDWIGVAIKKIRGMPDAKDATTTARLDALKKNKTLDEELQRRRTSVRFEPTQLLMKTTRVTGTLTSKIQSKP